VAPASLMEQFVAISVILVLLGTGFFSEPWLELTEHSLKGLTELFAQEGAH